jgi:hypothetical protein
LDSELNLALYLDVCAALYLAFFAKSYKSQFRQLCATLFGSFLKSKLVQL